MNKLTESVLKLKELLGENGEYTIIRMDRTPMDITEMVMVGNVLTSISNELTRNTTKEKKLYICPECGDRILKPGCCYNEYCSLGTKKMGGK